eukprot:4377477-Pyramimonas_sp.AAC.1
MYEYTPSPEISRELFKQADRQEFRGQKLYLRPMHRRPWGHDLLRRQESEHRLMTVIHDYTMLKL